MLLRTESKWPTKQEGENRREDKKDKDPENRWEHLQRQEDRCRRRIKHCVVPFEPQKCLEKPERGLQPDNGVLQEPRRLDEYDIKQADCG